MIDKLAGVVDNIHRGVVDKCILPIVHLFPERSASQAQAGCEDSYSRKYAFYTIFTLATVGTQFGLCALFTAMPVIAYAATALVGGIMQGRPSCIKQKIIETEHPIAAFVAGAINAFMCCAIYTLLASAATAVVGSAVLGAIIGGAASVAISAELMCAFESGFNTHIGSKFAKYREFQKERSCCKKKVR